MADAVRDAKIKFLSSLSKADEFDATASTLLAEYPEHVPLRLAILEQANKNAGKITDQPSGKINHDGL